MPYVYLMISVLMVASANVFGKTFNIKNEGKRDSSPFYTFILMLSVFLGWGILYAFDFSFDSRVLTYSLLFGFSYIAANIGIINALKHGPVALTSLINSMSLIVTTIWGFFFWDSPVTLTVIAGIVLVVCSLTLCLYTKSTDNRGFSLKWLFYVSMAMSGNAGCAIVQRTQQNNFGGRHGNMLMLVATGISALTCLVIYKRSDRRASMIMLKTSWWVPVLAGACNVMLNLLVMLMATTELSTSLIYPVISVGSLAIVTVFSLFVFKEKMRPSQWVGVAVGAVAVVLLSI